MAAPSVAFPDVVIAVRDVRAQLGGEAVQDGVTMEVHRGSIFALAGPSGSGKTLLLREVIGLHRPDSGSIEVLGRDVAALETEDVLALRQRCGVVFERAALFSSLTVCENVALPLRERTGMGRALRDELAALKLGLVGLPRSAGPKLPSQLSSGMRKRAAVARAIALDPELLLLDEPSAGLDPEGARSFEELIRRLNELLGLTIVVVTRDLGLLWNAADEVAFLATGRIVATGTIDEVSSSEDPRVRSYFSAARGRTPEGDR